MDLTAQVRTTLYCAYYALMHFVILHIIVPDPCLSDPCDINHGYICEREGLLSDHFVCTCQPPFTGFNCSGMICNKIATFLICMIVLINISVQTL